MKNFVLFSAVAILAFAAGSYYGNVQPTQQLKLVGGITVNLYGDLKEVSQKLLNTDVDPLDYEHPGDIYAYCPDDNNKTVICIGVFNLKDNW